MDTNLLIICIISIFYFIFVLIICLLYIFKSYIIGNYYLLQSQPIFVTLVSFCILVFDVTNLFANVLDNNKIYLIKFTIIHICLTIINLSYMYRVLKIYFIYKENTNKLYDINNYYKNLYIIKRLFFILFCFSLIFNIVIIVIFNKTPFNNQDWPYYPSYSLHVLNLVILYPIIIYLLHKT